MMTDCQTLSSIPAPTAGDAGPLLPFETDQLTRLKAALSNATPRVRRALLGLDADPYQWMNPELMEMVG
jgi:hypothetical protein